MKDASSDTRKFAAEATSIGSPTLPIGISFIYLSSSKFLNIGVRITPGHIAFIR